MGGSGTSEQRGWRARSALRVAAGLLGLGLLASCRSSPPEPPPPPPVPAAVEDPDVFSAVHAWSHFEALAGIGPRPPGSGAARRARDYLQSELEALGAPVVTIEQPIASPDGEPIDAVHLRAELPGESPDVFLLAASYDSVAPNDVEGGGVNEGSAGPALLLELGRVLARRPRPFTIWLVMIEGDALAADAARFPGSEALATRLVEDGSLDRVRLAVFFDRVADADLGIARDLRSHRLYREIFFDAARRLGRDAAFAAEGGLASPPGAHQAFLDHGLRRVVAIVDDRYGEGEPPGEAWRRDDRLERCSAGSLETVGVVSLEALERIAARLAKIDRFVAAPLDALPAEPPTPTPSEAEAIAAEEPAAVELVTPTP